MSETPTSPKQDLPEAPQAGPSPNGSRAKVLITKFLTTTIWGLSAWG